MKAPWLLEWFTTGIMHIGVTAWRGVEAQHVVSTMRLVDTTDEQYELERILEASKPAKPQESNDKHYLLFTPFRYRPAHASRFRRDGDPGLWYGAESLYAACAEVAYWRYRFILDSAGLINSELLTEHTFFQARVEGSVIDLSQDPWVVAREVWTHPHDYSGTQALADQARVMGVQWIRYESVRASGHRCAAVLDVQALAPSLHDLGQQTWHCRATRSSVRLTSAQQSFEWDF